MERVDVDDLEMLKHPSIMRRKKSKFNGKESKVCQYSYYLNFRVYSSANAVEMATKNTMDVDKVNYAKEKEEKR